jgi:hypothetical protein
MFGLEVQGNLPGQIQVTRESELHQILNPNFNPQINIICVT